MTTELLGLRTVIYYVDDLDAAKQWWAEQLGVEAYFDEVFYVGFNVAGYELGLVPSSDDAGTSLTYWGVDDVDAAFDAALEAGASVHEAPGDVGDGIVTGSVRTPQGNVVGFIYNPHVESED
jgi:catechol 2,3-dioxygenase-like lactoylglutathione lyase family enzyme